MDERIEKEKIKLGLYLLECAFNILFYKESEMGMNLSSLVNSTLEYGYIMYKDKYPNEIIVRINK